MVIIKNWNKFVFMGLFLGFTEHLYTDLSICDSLPENHSVQLSSFSGRYEAKAGFKDTNNRVNVRQGRPARSPLPFIIPVALCIQHPAFLHSKFLHFFPSPLPSACKHGRLVRSPFFPAIIKVIS
jgi:hypothetical protein